MALHNIGIRLLQKTQNVLVVFQKRSKAIYTNASCFNEEEIKEKLQAFPGGSIDLIKQDSGIAVLTINNPNHKNAFTGTMMIQLKDRIDQLEQWTEGKGLIVQGTANTFCSGSDLNAVRALSSCQWIEQGEAFHDVRFTDETTVALEQFSTMSFYKKGRYVNKQNPKQTCMPYGVRVTEAKSLVFVTNVTTK